MTLRLVRIGLVVLAVLFAGAVLAPTQVGTPGHLIALLIEALPDIVLVLMIFALFDVLLRLVRRKTRPVLGSSSTEVNEGAIEPTRLSRLGRKARRLAR